MDVTPGEIAHIITSLKNSAAEYCPLCRQGAQVFYVGAGGYVHGTPEGGDVKDRIGCTSGALHEFMRASGIRQFTDDGPQKRPIYLRTQSERITEEWLKEVGFKWHELERSPHKHWLLWLGEALSSPRRMWSSYDDLGIELTPSIVDDNGAGEWHCWVRGDTAGRYHRFIHTRYLKSQHELILMIEGLTGQVFDPANNIAGMMRLPERAKALRQESERLDRQWQQRSHSRAKWYEVKKDDTRAGALPEDLEQAARQREEGR